MHQGRDSANAQPAQPWCPLVCAAAEHVACRARQAAAVGMCAMPQGCRCWAAHAPRRAWASLPCMLARHIWTSAGTYMYVSPGCRRLWRYSWADRRIGGSGGLRLADAVSAVLRHGPNGALACAGHHPCGLCAAPHHVPQGAAPTRGSFMRLHALPGGGALPSTCAQVFRPKMPVRLWCWFIIILCARPLLSRRWALGHAGC